MLGLGGLGMEHGALYVLGKHPINRAGPPENY